MSAFVESGSEIANVCYRLQRHMKPAKELLAVENVNCFMGNKGTVTLLLIRNGEDGYFCQFDQGIISCGERDAQLRFNLAGSNNRSADQKFRQFFYCRV